MPTDPTVLIPLDRPSPASTAEARRHEVEALISPEQLHRVAPRPDDTATLVRETRAAIRAIHRGEDPRLLVVVGPCSIHDPKAALAYAEWLAGQRDRYADRLLLVMRAYVEKPRTRLGWKGLINDPLLDDSFRIGEGLRLARRLLLDIAALGLPTATEFLGMDSTAFLEDLTSWSAIGARTSESPLHRQLASGLPCPVGFKNSTDGRLDAAINGIMAARSPHHLMSMAPDGRLAVMATTGNPDGHLILRGGRGPNHRAPDVAQALATLAEHGLPTRLLVDCGHGNSGGHPGGQVEAARDVARQLRDGATGIMGIMLESHLVEGAQPFVPGQPLAWGQSITDPCIGLEATAAVLEELAGASGVR